MASTKFTILARSFSTSGAVNQLIKPPIQVFGIEGRYATALYSAASKEKKLDAVEKELVQFQGVLKSDVKLNEFILNPTIKKQTKTEGVKAIASKAGLSPASANLLQILAENGRLKKLNGVINAFKTIMSAHRGEVRLLLRI
nr:ATP synthase subunit O, mitochondrial-like [Onthophagus taurus]